MAAGVVDGRLGDIASAEPMLCMLWGANPRLPLISEAVTATLEWAVVGRISDRETSVPGSA